MLRNKSIKIFINYFLGPLLFLWLLYAIYAQLVRQPHLEQSWQHVKQAFASAKIIVLLLVVLLMLVNWSIEAAKWKLSVAALAPLSFLRAFEAVLSGVSLSVSMPNRMGEYAGRILYLPEGSRLKAVPLSVAGGISQLLITLVAGIMGLMVLKDALIHAGLVSAIWYRFLLFGTAVAIFILTVIYFGLNGFSRLLERRLRHSRHYYLLQSLQALNRPLLLRLLLLSFFRYIVFTLQYVLLFSFFEVHVAAYLVWSVTSVLFLAMAVIPTVALAELGLRGQLSLQLMGLYSANSLGVVITSVTAWTINLIVPALAGSILILTFKFFKRTHEVV
jgi:hypothetical protein